LVNGQQPVDRLYFHDQNVVDDEVEAIATFELDPLVLEGDGYLALETKPAQRELMSDALFVRRFQQSGPQVPVHLDASPDDLLRYPLCLSVSLCHVPLSVRAVQELRVVQAAETHSQS
jgi:hypothetical protein